MPWVVVGLVIGLVAVGVGIAAVLVVRRRDPDLAESRMTGDQLFMLGVIFTGTGVALAVSIGPHMLGILALGIIYMGMGATMKRRDAKDAHKGTT